MLTSRSRSRLSQEDCCGPRRCDRSVTMIQYVQWLRWKFRGEDVHEVVASVFEPSEGYEMGRSDGFGPKCEATWACLIGEVEAAERAGCRTAEEIAARLCEFSSSD